MLAHLRGAPANADRSKGAIRKGTRSRIKCGNDEVDEAIKELAAEGAIKDTGTKAKQCWVIA